MSDARAWFAARTAGAPPVLAARAAHWFDAADGASAAARCAEAGRAALDAAMVHGPAREAALDLLAADALITLALLASADADAATLGATATALRAAAEVAA